MNAVVLGNGVAGVTAALALRKALPQARVVLVSAESDTFFSRTALMYVFMRHMRLKDTEPYPEWFWREQRIERLRGLVGAVDVGAARLVFDDGRTLPYDRLVLATGSTPNRFGWPGQDLPGVQGLYSLQDLARLEENVGRARRAVLVGGGLIGVELAEMLHSRGLAVTILARETAYWNNVLPDLEARLVGAAIERAGIEVRFDTRLSAIEAGADGRVASVLTEAGERLPCQLVGLTAGVRPNLSALAGSAVPVGRGVRVDAALRTGVEGIWACGDCAELCPTPDAPGQVEQLWYTARAQGEICGQNAVDGGARPYVRGLPFNSAKFFDLEWHTYGEVEPGAGRPEPVEDRVYEDAARGRLLRLSVRGGRLVGVNALGLRQRQAVWTRLIEAGAPPERAIEALDAAAFDPNWTPRLAREVAAALRGRP